MKPEDFDLFATMLKQRSGLMLTREKSYLLESRLVNVMRRWNLKSFEDMAHTVRERRDEALMADITDAMMASDTQFFRDRQVFKLFRDIVLPRLLASRGAKRHMRIWSAATASGQEAYSLAMLLAEEGDKLAGWHIDIMASDLSRDAIERAKTGAYSLFDVQRGLPIRLLVKYFHQHGDKWQLKDSIRHMVQFRHANLIADLTPVGSFDVIFCCNVLDSFDPPTQTRVSDELSSHLATDGYLVIGREETTSGISDKFKAVENAGNYILSLTGKFA